MGSGSGDSIQDEPNVVAPAAQCPQSIWYAVLVSVLTILLAIGAILGTIVFLSGSSSKGRMGGCGECPAAFGTDDYTVNVGNEDVGQGASCTGAHKPCLIGVPSVPTSTTATATTATAVPVPYFDLLPANVRRQRDTDTTTSVTRRHVSTALAGPELGQQHVSVQQEEPLVMGADEESGAGSTQAQRLIQEYLRRQTLAADMSRPVSGGIPNIGTGRMRPGDQKAQVYQLLAIKIKVEDGGLDALTPMENRLYHDNDLENKSVEEIKEWYKNSPEGCLFKL